MEGDPCARRKIAIRSRGSNPGGCHGRRLSALRRQPQDRLQMARSLRPNKALPDWPINPNLRAQTCKRLPFPPGPSEREILALRAGYPNWGEDKLKAGTRAQPTLTSIGRPVHYRGAAETHGLTHPGKRRLVSRPRVPLVSSPAPRRPTKFGRSILPRVRFDTGDGKRCDPLRAGLVRYGEPAICCVVKGSSAATRRTCGR